MGLPTERCEKPIRVTGADGQLLNGSEITYQTPPARVRIGDEIVEETFLITELVTKCLLGYTWLAKVNPIINWAEHTMRIRGNTIVATQVHEPADGEQTIAALEWIPTQDKDDETFENDLAVYDSLFDPAAQDALPERTEFDHRIQLRVGPDKYPAPAKIIPLSRAEERELEEWTALNLKRGFIARSESSFAAPVFFVSKKDGSKRLVTDYRELNKVTERDSFPLPLIPSILNRVGKGKVFSQLDLRGAYNLVRIAEGDEPKTAFRTHQGLFEYRVMPFGLMNAPATFQRMMNVILEQEIGKFCEVYLDDMIIYSENEGDHAVHLKQVMSKLEQNKLLVKKEKCHFYKPEVEFLGYRVMYGYIGMAPSKIEAVTSWKAPNNKRAIQRFLGFANFYRRFIRNYTMIVKPLQELTKNIPFKWGNAQDEAFRKLKTAFVHGPILAQFDVEKEVWLETDASDFAIAAVFSQQHDGRLHPVSFFSRSLSDAERNYDVHDKELLAVVAAFGYWRVWLTCAKQITVATDHRNLLYFFNKEVWKQRHWRWREVLESYPFKFLYRSGSQQVVPDALSRKEELKKHRSDPDDVPDKPLFETNRWEEVKDGNERSLRVAMIRASEPEEEDELTRDEYFQETPEELLRIATSFNSDFIRDQQQIPGTTIVEGLVKRGGRIVVPDQLRIRERLIAMRHDLPLAAHRGITKTVELLRRDFEWPGLSEMVSDYVRGCEICKRSAPNNHQPYGLLNPLKIPRESWQCIGMDFIGPLPVSEGYDMILVVVDRFSKMVHLVKAKATWTTEDFARAFIDEIIRLHGIPEEIVSDRGPTFRSRLWEQISRRLRIRLKHSTAYHPQTNGQTERTNAVVKQALRAFLDYNQQTWAQWLSVTEFTINNTKSEATQQTPFRVVYGKDPRMDLAELGIDEDDPRFEPHVHHIMEIQEQVRSELTKAQKQQTEVANRRRLQTPKILVGDRVWVNASNYRSRRPSKSLDYTRLGPYEVLEVRERDTFVLAIPKNMRIHNVFHASALEKHHETNYNRPKTRRVREEGITNGEYPRRITQIFDSRPSGRYGRQYFVEWDSGTPGDRTWEREADVRRENPRLLRDYLNGV